MELHRDTPYCRNQGMLYKGRELCPEAVAFMASIGFKYVGHVTEVRQRSPGRGGPVRQVKVLASPERCPTDAGKRGKFCEMQAYFINQRSERGPPISVADLPWVE